MEPFVHISVIVSARTCQVEVDLFYGIYAALGMTVVAPFCASVPDCDFYECKYLYL